MNGLPRLLGAFPDAMVIVDGQGQIILVQVLEAPDSFRMGRFGWKNQQASLLSFAGDAYINEMGITNTLFPDEVTTVCEPEGVAHPNDKDNDLPNLAAYMRATKVPPRGPITTSVLQGQQIFQVPCW